MTNRKTQLLDELSQKSYFINDPSFVRSDRYKPALLRIAAIRRELKQLDSGNLAESSPLASALGEGNQ